MSDEYALEILRCSLVQIVHNHGFNAASNFSLDVLLDVYRKYLQSFCRDLREVTNDGLFLFIFTNFKSIKNNSSYL